MTWVELQSESSCLPLGHLQDQESQEYLIGENNESKKRISIRVRRLTLCITFVTYNFVQYFISLVFVFVPSSQHVFLSRKVSF